MLYKTIQINKSDIKDSLINYLYDNKYDDIIHINKNRSIDYYIDSDTDVNDTSKITKITKITKIYVSSNLFSGYDVHDISKIDLTDFNKDVDINKYNCYSYELSYTNRIHQNNKYIQIKLNQINKINLKLFTQLCIYLYLYYGEYDHIVFDIIDKQYYYELYYRYEKS
jgi:hypothetical protein